MVYPTNAPFPAVNIAVDPVLQSRLLDGNTDLEQALIRLDQVGGIGQRVSVNMLTVAPVAGAVGVWAPAINAAHLCNGAFDNGAADALNNEFSVDLFIPTAGTWTLLIAAPQDLDAPIVQLFLDAVQIGLAAGYDLYQAAPDPDSFIGISGLVIAAGLHRLRFLVSGANAASAGFVLRVNQIEFRRTT